MFKVDFIVQAYSSQDEEYSEELLASVVAKIELEDARDMEGAAGGSSIAPEPVDKHIQSVLDVLPHLQSDFVRRLLGRYESPELAIAAVLEGNLPPDLEETEDVSAVSAPVEQLAGVLDNMDFGRKGRTESVVVKSGKGFPGQPKNLKAMLDDKSHVRALKSRYQEYGLVPEQEYDDEYDDSYEALADNEPKAVRSQGNLAARNFVVDEVDDDEEESDDADDDPSERERDRNRDFCENPEAVRDRWAQSRNSKIAARYPGKPVRPQA